MAREDFLKVVRGASTQELNEYRQILGRMISASFVIGDKVKFDAGRRGVIAGVITGINQKSMKVKADYGMTWRVAPSLLQKG